MATHAATREMKRPQEASQTVLALSDASDIAFARASAAAIRATPGVADLSPGLMVLAATYGPHERVAGVVVRHTSPDDTAVEVHVVIEVAAGLTIATRGDGSGAAPENTSEVTVSEVAVLAQIASRVRAAVYRVASSMSLVPLPTVDVYIDDIQAPDALERSPAR